VFLFLPASIALAGVASAGVRLDEIVVTATRMQAPLTVITDARPRASRCRPTTAPITSRPSPGFP